MDVFLRGDHFAVIGTLHDQRPWAGGEFGPRDLHFMELGIVVRRADLMIVDAAVDMRTYPHAECTDIEASFRDLVGLSVARGYTSAVQERFGRQRGCSHVEFLARAVGPVVVQGVTSSGAWEVEKGSGEHPMGEGGFGFLADTCHIWTQDGPGPQKIALGWHPGLFGLSGAVGRGDPPPPGRHPRGRLTARTTTAERRNGGTEIGLAVDAGGPSSIHSELGGSKRCPRRLSTQAASARTDIDFVWEVYR